MPIILIPIALVFFVVLSPLIFLKTNNLPKNKRIVLRGLYTLAASAAMLLCLRFFSVVY
jgi:hypothetical protein